jgi:hypothetical protein
MHQAKGIFILRAIFSEFNSVLQPICRQFNYQSTNYQVSRKIKLFFRLQIRLDNLSPLRDVIHTVVVPSEIATGPVPTVAAVQHGSAVTRCWYWCPCLALLSMKHGFMAPLHPAAHLHLRIYYRPKRRS